MHKVQGVQYCVREAVFMRALRSPCSGGEETSIQVPFYPQLWAEEALLLVNGTLSAIWKMRLQKFRAAWLSDHLHQYKLQFVSSVFLCSSTGTVLYQNHD